MTTQKHKRGTFGDWSQRTQVFKTLADIMQRYDWSEGKGLVTDAGKHEGNPPQTVYFYEVSYVDGGAEFFASQDVHVMEASTVEREIFGAMPGCKHFRITEDDNGFVYGQWIDMRGLRVLRRTEAEYNIANGED